jgi:hypothetical protein
VSRPRARRERDDLVDAAVDEQRRDGDLIQLGHSLFHLHAELPGGSELFVESRDLPGPAVTFSSAFAEVTARVARERLEHGGERLRSPRPARADSASQRIASSESRPTSSAPRVRDNTPRRGPALPVAVPPLAERRCYRRRFTAGGDPWIAVWRSSHFCCAVRAGAGRRLAMVCGD